MARPLEFEDLKTRAGEVSALLKMISHPNRLLIACELVGGETTVSALEAATGAPQPILSRDLGRMRTAGLVKTRRDSKYVFYRLADDRLERLIGALCDAFGPTPDPREAAASPSLEDCHEA